MEFGLVAMVAVQVTFVLGLVGIGSRVWLKKKELDKLSNAEDIKERLERLEAGMNELQESCDTHIAELYERIDATERMLTQGRGERGRALPREEAGDSNA